MIMPPADRHVDVFALPPGEQRRLAAAKGRALRRWWWTIGPDADTAEALVALVDAIHFHRLVAQLDDEGEL